MKTLIRRYGAVILLIMGFALGVASKETVLYLGPKKRVYVDMVADLFHAGHIEFLKKASTFGDTLIVGVHSDEVCLTYQQDPICSMNERLQTVSACRYVDEVVANAPLKVTDKWIRTHKIDVIVHGDDISPEQAQEFYGPAIKKGIFHTVPYTQGISTSEIIDRVKRRRAR